MNHLGQAYCKEVSKITVTVRFNRFGSDCRHSFAVKSPIFSLTRIIVDISRIMEKTNVFNDVPLLTMVLLYLSKTGVTFDMTQKNLSRKSVTQFQLRVW